VDVVALGESMVAFLPSRPGRLADVPSFDRGIGGAEPNVDDDAWGKLRLGPGRTHQRADEEVRTP
jgi:hypothetical protein